MLLKQSQVAPENTATVDRENRLQSNKKFIQISSVKWVIPIQSGLDTWTDDAYQNSRASTKPLH